MPPPASDRPPSARCRCEATMPAEVLDGFSCGLPDCWRAPLVQASFDSFVADLIRSRGDEPVPPPVVVSG